jgi:hypothetical protein
MRCRFWIVALLIPGFILAVAESAIADLAAEFLKQAPEGWAALERASGTLQFKADCTTTMVQKDGSEKQRNRERWLYKRNGRRQLFEKESLDDDAIPSLVFAENSRYGFKLTKDRGASEWFVNEASSDPRDREHVAAAIDVLAKQTTEIGWALPIVSLATLVNARSFKLINCVEDSESSPGSHLVKVDFELSPTRDELKLPGHITSRAELKSISGKLVLDREHFWAITGYDVRFVSVMAGSPVPFEPRYIADVKYELSQAPSGVKVPVPAQVRLEMIGAAGALKKEIEVVESSLDELPEKDFTLVAYGLPDLGQLSTGSGGGRSVAGYIFIVASIIGILTLLLARKRIERSENQ